MAAFSYVALVLVAPLIYALLGAPLALWLSPERPGRFALLSGAVISGVLAELAMFGQVPAPWLLFSAAAVNAALVFRQRARLRVMKDELREAALFYTASVFAAAVSPFPILGEWSGDWWLTFSTGREVLAGALGADHLARPPLFGAAMLPLWTVVSAFPAYQVFACVASAATAQQTAELLERLTGKKLSAWQWLPMLLSIFFLHNTAAAWSKFLAAALVLGSWNLAIAERRWRAALLFGAGVAVHEGAVVWGVATLLLLAPRPKLVALLREGARMAAAVAAVAGPLILWTLLRFGLAARVAANPVLTDRSSDPFLVKASFVMLCTFVGWGPLTVIARWGAHAEPFAREIINKEGYWLATAVITTLAGTLLGALLPWLLAAGRRSFAGWLAPLGSHRTALLVGTGFATVATGALSPYYSEQGCLQVAHAPLAFLVFALLTVRAEQLGLARRWILTTLLFSTLPWFLLNFGVSAGLRFSAALRDRFRNGSEGDYLRVVVEGLPSLGLDTFPILFVVTGVALLVLLRRSTVSAR